MIATTAAAAAMGSLANGSGSRTKDAGDHSSAAHHATSTTPSSLDLDALVNGAMPPPPPPFDFNNVNQGFYGPMEHNDHRQQALHIPESPAPQGYLANPYKHVAIEAHNLLQQRLAFVDESQWQNARMDDGVAILPPTRDLTHANMIPATKGRTFMPNCRPIEVLAAVHLFSYRLIYDTRMSSGRVLQRYSYHSFLFYCVWRGVGPIYNPRDAVGVQDVRAWDSNGEEQTGALPSSDRIDVVWRSVDGVGVPAQDGKERMRIELGAYRIQWRPELNGCDVTFVGEADLCVCIPSYLWKVLAMELPKIVGRCRGAIQRFGIPPYVVDPQECVVVQTTFFYSEARRATNRHHVRKAGSYKLMIDRQRMYPYGISTPTATGPGAHAVTLQEVDDGVIVSVSPMGVGQEYVVTLEPRDKESERVSQNGWW